MRHLRLLFAAYLAAGLLAAAPATGAEAGASVVLGEVLDDAALDDMRGGFSFAGVNIGFGAHLRSFVDGALVMESRLTLDPGSTAAIVSSTSGAETLTLSALSDITARMSGGASFGAIGPDGVTVLHNFSDGQISNVLINTSSDRDLRQELALTLNLPGFESAQTGMATNRLGNDLAMESSLFVSQTSH